MRNAMRAMVWAVVLGAVGGVAPAAELSEAETASLLQRLEADRKQGGARVVEFREERRSRLAATPLVTEGTMTFAAPARFRRESRGRNESLMVSDGRVLWIYFPAFQEAERYDLTGRGGAAVLPLISASLSLEGIEEKFRVRAEALDGGWRLRLEPRAADQRRMVKEVTVTVGEDLRVRQAEWISAEGDRTVTTFANERRVNAREEDFSFQPPDGVTVVEPLGR